MAAAKTITNFIFARAKLRIMITPIAVRRNLIMAYLSNPTVPEKGEGCRLLVNTPGVNFLMVGVSRRLPGGGWAGRLSGRL